MIEDNLEIQDTIAKALTFQTKEETMGVRNSEIPDIDNLELIDLAAIALFMEIPKFLVITIKESMEEQYNQNQKLILGEIFIHILNRIFVKFQVSILLGCCEIVH